MVFPRSFQRGVRLKTADENEGGAATTRRQCSSHHHPVGYFTQFHFRGWEKNNCKRLLADSKKISSLTVDGTHKSMFEDTHDKVHLQRLCSCVVLVQWLPELPLM